jgi:hypothetical protein
MRDDSAAQVGYLLPCVSGVVLRSPVGHLTQRTIFATSEVLDSRTLPVLFYFLVGFAHYAETSQNKLARLV